MTGEKQTEGQHKKEKKNVDDGNGKQISLWRSLEVFYLHLVMQASSIEVS